MYNVIFVKPIVFNKFGFKAMKNLVNFFEIIYEFRTLVRLSHSSVHPHNRVSSGLNM